VRTCCSALSPVLITLVLASESAATLEAESGYVMETSRVAEFRRCILEGMWSEAESALEHLGVAENDGLWVCFIAHDGTFLNSHSPVFRRQSSISANRNILNTLKVARHRWPYTFCETNLLPSTRTRSCCTHFQGLSYSLHHTSKLKLQLLIMTSLVMCMDAADLRQKASWDGAHGSSRRKLLVNLQSEFARH